MTRRKRNEGVTLFSGDFVRFVDVWREAAARPLKAMRMSSTHKPGAPFADAVWTLEEDGKPIACWREAHMPGFAWWLQARLYELHGAHHVARTELGVQAKRVEGAKNSAARKKREAAVRDQKLAEAAAKIRKPDPGIKKVAVAGILADRRFGARSTIEKKLTPKKSHDGR